MLLVILQATDAAGKDGAIRHVMSGVNPQGCRVYSFKQPSEAELEHDFLWRTTRDLPERGRIAIFNRSYYEEVLVVRVHPDILDREAIPDPPHHDKKVWRERYRSINDFERHLDVNGTRVVKIFLHLSKEEQRKRFLERIDDPDKNWKFSDADLKERKFWDDYAEGLRGMPQRDEHRRRALVCRSRRRQGKRPADRLANRPRHVRRARDELSEDERRTGARVAGDPQGADQVTARPSGSRRLRMRLRPHQMFRSLRFDVTRAGRSTRPDGISEAPTKRLGIGLADLIFVGDALFGRMEDDYRRRSRGKRIH